MSEGSVLVAIGVAVWLFVRCYNAATMPKDPGNGDEIGPEDYDLGTAWHNTMDKRVAKVKADSGAALFALIMLAAAFAWKFLQ